MSGKSLSFDFEPVKLEPPPHPEPVKAEPPPPEPVKVEEPKVLTVGDLGRVLRGALDSAFAAPVWVEGEVSGARPAPSGHLYFSLKDEREDASLDVAMYKTSLTPRVRGLLTDGARVRIRGRPSFWAPRGRLQFVADRADPVGKGALLEALEKLKAKLAAEGLFAPERKRPLPAEPRIVGVVTSARGAVIHDIAKVAFRRGGARILLAPAVVQGEGAPRSIVAALRALQQVAEVDVIVVGRGGGSADDLAAFNDEAVVRAVAASSIPVVSAVGHEVDVTLTDFAADARAATPSQAAEMITPDGSARRALLGQQRTRLLRAMAGRVTEERVELGQLRRRMGDPRLTVASLQQSLDERRARLQTVVRRTHGEARGALGRASERLAYVHPRAVLARERSASTLLHTRLVRAGELLAPSRATALATADERLARVAATLTVGRGAQLGHLGARLDALSPLKVLGRGYAIVTDQQGHAVRRASVVAVGQRIAVKLEEGQLAADVVTVENEPS